MTFFLQSKVSILARMRILDYVVPNKTKHIHSLLIAESGVTDCGWWWKRIYEGDGGFICDKIFWYGCAGLAPCGIWDAAVKLCGES